MKTNRMMPQLFEKYELMDCSKKPRKRGREVPVLKMLPHFSEEEVLDIEFGQHCRCAI